MGLTMMETVKPTVKTATVERQHLVKAISLLLIEWLHQKINMRQATLNAAMAKITMVMDSWTVPIFTASTILQ
jgi:hypothetical protein